VVTSLYLGVPNSPFLLGVVLLYLIEASSEVVREYFTYLHGRFFLSRHSRSSRLVITYKMWGKMAALSLSLNNLNPFHSARVPNSFFIGTTTSKKFISILFPTVVD